MNDRTQTLDDVLFGFHQAADTVTPQLLSEWTARYPEFADEIRAHAVEIIDMELLAEIRSPAPVAAPAMSAVTLRSALQEAGTSLRDFADGLDISRSIVADVNTGRIDEATIPRRFSRLAASRLQRSPDWFHSVVVSSNEAAFAPSFKASELPSAGRQRTWEEAVRGSDMSEERKAFWLAED
ncbi:hypothetical protein [Aureimonas ureilytica]|uniref:hypothetical protein n=1 Tax=Aureimonas ureilytica TaxID=401562 RepID=UPI0003605B72|nr:hypothetical protein [Aureimonas ureilytica]